MRTRDDDKEVRVVKVPLQEFIANLMQAYTAGADYIDLVITKDEMQDMIGIHIRNDKPVVKEIKKLTEEDINELLQ